MQSSMRLHARGDLGGLTCSAPSSRWQPGCSPVSRASMPCQYAFARTAPCSQTWRACRRPRGHVQVLCMRDDASEVDAVPDSLPVAAPGADWRAFRARLIAANKAEAAANAFAPTTATTTPSSPADATPAADLPDHWAHELPWPEKGCVLVAHPSLFVDRQTYFQQAVILLLDHGPNGSYGVILNKPTQYTMGQIKSSVAQLLSSFAGNRLYMGGDVGETAMAVVTRRPGILGSTEVAAGLYHHTVHAAQQAVEQGQAAPGDFRFFAQYAGWAPGQLAKECQAGVWFCAAASPALVLDEGLAAGKELWHRVLEIMGGDHARVSQLVREVERGMRRKDPAPSQPPQQQQQQQQQSPPAPTPAPQAQSQQQPPPPKQQQQQQAVPPLPQAQKAKVVPPAFTPTDKPTSASNGNSSSSASSAKGVSASGAAAASSPNTSSSSNGAGAPAAPAPPAHGPPTSSSSRWGPAAAAASSATEQPQRPTSSRPPAGSAGASSSSSSAGSGGSGGGGSSGLQQNEEGGPAAA